MDHLHQEEPDFLDLDKPGYYFPLLYEMYVGAEYEVLEGNRWVSKQFDQDLVGPPWEPSYIRVRYLQAKDILALGFGRVQNGMHMYLRGSYTIIAYRLFDPTYSKIRIMQASTPVYEGICKNKSELKRILKINEIDFADS